MLEALPSSLAVTVDLTISEGDVMFDATAPDRYLRAGANAYAAIKRLLTLHGKGQPENILDFGCGHGRVMRWLRAAWPTANIVGADVGEAGVSFCAELFSSTEAVCGVDFDRLGPFAGQDLIWSGSVFTHLLETDSRRLFQHFRDWLVPGGIALFSSHGRAAARNMEWGTIDYTDGLGHDHLLREFSSGRYGFTAYRETPNYGVSLIPSSYWYESVGERADMRVSYFEQLWSGHHDIVALQRYN